MITGLSISFLILALLLWLSSYGYLLILSVLARCRRRQATGQIAKPRIAVIVPTLNEESFIRGKLDDLLQTDYPQDRMTVIVADGGSHDGTTGHVEDFLSRGEPISLRRLPDARGKADQIVQVLSTLDHDIIVITDVDARLEPSCIRKLVTTLVEDRRTGMVGASVHPHTRLLEERLHWRLVNYLWWLEGEALSSALVSGVCFAARREVLQALVPHAATDDVQLALAAGARGHRVRICSNARATEMRVPQSTRELLQFRRRRGSAYLSELVRSLRYVDAPSGWRLARYVRLWHFFATPVLTALFAVSAAALLWTPHWPLPVVTIGAFVVPAFSFLVISPRSDRPRFHFSQVGLATTRLVMLTCLSLAMIARSAEFQLPARNSQ